MPSTDARDETWLLRELSRLAAAVTRRSPTPILPPTLPLGEAGLDSVMLAELSAELEARYGIELPLSELFDLSLDALARHITATPAHPASSSRAMRSENAPRASAPSSAKPPHQQSLRHGRAQAPQLSLFCFGELGVEPRPSYDLILDCAKLADRLGLTALWLPERHFHPFGGVSPNPTVLAAALTQVTHSLRLRAGSVILPLHQPVRVAEEWSVIDNLSAGRVDLAFGWGWNPNDFVLAPERFTDRRERTLAGIELIEKLWRGEEATSLNGQGVAHTYQLYPRPVQRSLPVWLTCTRDAQSFITAGAQGYNVLTGLLFQSEAQLGDNLALYRAARARHGHDPDSGVVTVMLHTLLGTDQSEVRAAVREPFLRYLRSARTLWSQGHAPLAKLSQAQQEASLNSAFERYFASSALFGTPATAAALVQRLGGLGVGEIACLVDFGVPAARVLSGIHQLAELRRRWPSTVESERHVE